MIAASSARALALFLSVVLLSCAGRPPAAKASPAEIDETAVASAVAARARAIADGDKAAFMALAAPGDASFILERSRWFDYRMSAAVSDFSSKILGVTPVGGSECVVSVAESYRIGPGRELRAYSCDRRYRKVDGEWLDADLDFSALSTAHFDVKATRDVAPERIASIAVLAERGREAVALAYGAAPERRVAIKLYGDRELLRQDSKITIGYLFSGWAEPGESIKAWVRPDPSYAYDGLVAHELVHIATLEASKNLCSWFAEGLASHYGNFRLKPGYLDAAALRRDGRPWSLERLGSFDPEAEGPPDERRDYYPAAATFMKFLEERHGAGAPRRVVEALAAYPQIGEGYVYARHDAACRAYLALAFEDALGEDAASLDAAWLSWMGATP